MLHSFTLRQPRRSTLLTVAPNLVSCSGLRPVGDARLGRSAWGDPPRVPQGFQEASPEDTRFCQNMRLCYGCPLLARGMNMNCAVMRLRDRRWAIDLASLESRDGAPRIIGTSRLLFSSVSEAVSTAAAASLACCVLPMQRYPKD